MQFAYQFPERTERVVLVAAAVGLIPRGALAQSSAKVRPPSAAQIAAARGMLDRGLVVLVEHTTSGRFRQVTLIGRVDAPQKTAYDLVADPEAQGRALVAAAGLEWDPACLEFTGNRRRVDTLSTFQVRQPLYGSSVAKWKRYEDDLSEMLEELERPR